MTAEQALVERYNEGSDEALTERYMGAEVRVTAEVEEGKLEDTPGTISHFEDGYVVVGGFEGFLMMYGFPVKWFETGEIRFEA